MIGRGLATMLALSLGAFTPAIPSAGPRLDGPSMSVSGKRKGKGLGVEGKNVFATGGSYFKPNGERECKRRRRQIGLGILTRSNGLAL